MNFWQRFEQASCFPDHCQCEFARDALIRQPSSFWSSGAYILAAFAIFRSVKDRTMDLRVWALVCVIMGLSSMLGHMSYIRITLALDFASIVLVMSFFAIWNALHSRKFSHLKIFLILALFYFLSFLGMYGLDKWGKISLCFLVLGVAVGDVIRERGWGFLGASTFRLCLLTLAVSFGFFLLDENHVACDPMSWFQFHSLWHLGSALSMFLYGKWRFESTRPA